MTEQSLAFTRGLSLPDAFSCGHLFAFSGMAGENFHKQDWCGVLTGRPGEIRFGGQTSALLVRFTESSPEYDVVVPDLIAAIGNAILVTFADAQTIIGRSDMMPAIRLETGSYVSGDRTIVDGEFAFSLATAQADDGVRFAICRRTDAETAEADAQNALLSDADALSNRILDWYLSCPMCPDTRYEKLWYKCLSVNRVNVCSPQNGFTHFFTMPNRLVHRDMQMLDSCFHATAIVHYAPALAKDTVLAVLDCQREDGFIPYKQHTRDEITFPPVLCATVWNLFEVTGDHDLLLQTAEPLRRYLEWDLQNRRSPNGLMTWHTQYADTQSRCIESGMDNSPRFDTEEPLEAIDFSVFIAYELLCLQRIYIVLGDHMSVLQTEGMLREMADRINKRLWDEQTHCYCDRTRNGIFHRTLTPASFLPLFAGICDPRQAQLLVAHLKPLLECPFPIPSAVDAQGGFFTHDLWRGGVWLHYNYFIYIGLQRYGFGKIASLLRQKTLEGVNKQFLDTGNVFAYYDPFGGDPLAFDENRSRPDTPAYTHPISDFNRSASFIQLFLCS